MKDHFCSRLIWFRSFPFLWEHFRAVMKISKRKWFFLSKFSLLPKQRLFWFECRAFPRSKLFQIHSYIQWNALGNFTNYQKISGVEINLSQENFIKFYFRCRVSDRCHVDPGICRKYRLVLGVFPIKISKIINLNKFGSRLQLLRFSGL